jgi:hypothetical protein
MSTISPSHPDTETVLKNAYLTLKSSKEGEGKKEQVFDNIGWQTHLVISLAEHFH